MLISFIILVLILITLCIILNYLFSKYFNRKALLLLLAPGVVVHELSHAVGCLLVGANIQEIKLFSPKGDTLGYVTHSKPKVPVIGQIIISIAPLIGCCLFLYLIALATNFPTDFDYTIDLSEKVAFTEVFQIIKDGIDVIINADFKSWETWVFLYLALSLSASIAPSSKDFFNMLPGIVILGFIVYLIYKISNNISQFDFISKIFTPLFSFGILMVVIALLITFPIVMIIRIIKY